MLTLRILLARLIDVGVYDLFEAVLFAFSGPLLRSVGLA
jgi:NADH:ubiquinone oxidoreductase subunit D